MSGTLTEDEAGRLVFRLVCDNGNGSKKEPFIQRKRDAATAVPTEPTPNSNLV